MTLKSNCQKETMLGISCGYQWKCKTIPRMSFFREKMLKILSLENILDTKLLMATYLQFLCSQSIFSKLSFCDILKIIGNRKYENDVPWWNSKFLLNFKANFDKIIVNILLSIFKIFSKFKFKWARWFLIAIFYWAQPSLPKVDAKI